MRDDDLRSALREHARRTEAASRPSTPEVTMRRSDQAAHHNPVLVAAMSVMVVGLLAAALWLRERDDGREVDAVQDPPATTTTSAPVAGYDGVPFEDLPPAGIAIVTDDDTILVLAEDGAPLAEVTDLELAAALGSDGAQAGMAITPGTPALPEPAQPDPAEPPPGCERARGGGGVRIALCGGQEQRRTQIVAVAADGAQRTLAEAEPAADGIGHWTIALPSPDGAWALAEWSGECESPSAVFVPTGGGAPLTVLGDPDTAGAPESHAVGWSADGRAIVQLGSGLCGTGADQPGTYLVDPANGARTLVRPASSVRDQVYRWTKQGHYANRLERALDRSLRELDLQGCCGEPSHGGDAVTGGARWDGVDIPVSGWPGAPMIDDLVITSRPEALDGLPVVVGEADLGAFVAFACGGSGWAVGGMGAGDRASEPQVVALASALIPHLYCTVGPRPEADGHGPAGP